jgi:hypothetical protein
LNVREEFIILTAIFLLKTIPKFHFIQDIMSYFQSSSTTTVTIVQMQCTDAQETNETTDDNSRPAIFLSHFSQR